MIASTVYLGICGLGLTFLPEEIAGHLDIGKNQSAILFLQILGSLYLGFAMLNWMTSSQFSIILLLTIIYCIFTLCFAYLFMTGPGKRSATE